jgi:hypothetical protein
VGERDPAAPADFREPRLIRRVVSKMIAVALHGQTACHQNRSELLAKIAVGEIDAGQAARS